MGATQYKMEVINSDWKKEAERLKFDQGKSWTETADVIRRKYFPGLTSQQAVEKVRTALRASARYQQPIKPTQSRQELKPDGSFVSDRVIEICEGEQLTPSLLLEKHNLVPALWTVSSYTNNYWHSQVKGGKQLVMYQSKVTAKPNAKGLSLDEIDRHYATLDAKPITVTYNPQGKYDAEVNIADLHLGKLCWHGDTGNNFDYKIARDVFYQIINDIAGELKKQPLDSILFVWANDFFNSDTITKTTTGGTPQDTDIRWQKLFDVGVEILVTAILTFAEIAPVTTFYTRSNHDEVTSYHALKYLDAYFRLHNGVTIDTSPKARKYYLLGNTLLGFAHGEKENAKRLSSLMPLEVPELWAKSEYREYHTAHLHSEHAINEINGVIVRRISSPTATDTWHYESGYVGAVRKAQTFLYDKQKGLRAIINTTV